MSQSIDVDQIPAGWGIDGLVAQRFLGYVKGDLIGDAAPYRFWWSDPEGKPVAQLPKLSEDFNEAIRVIEALYELGWKFGMTQNSDKEIVVAFVPNIEGEYDASRAIKARVPVFKLAALAVCRAALLVSAHIADDKRIEVVM